MNYVKTFEISKNHQIRKFFSKNIYIKLVRVEATRQTNNVAIIYKKLHYITQGDCCADSIQI